MFVKVKHFQTGKISLINLDYIDEIAPHDSGKGYILWSAKPGVKSYHVEDFWPAQISSAFVCFQGVESFGKTLPQFVKYEDVFKR